MTPGRSPDVKGAPAPRPGSHAEAGGPRSASAPGDRGLRSLLLSLSPSSCCFPRGLSHVLQPGPGLGLGLQCIGRTLWASRTLGLLPSTSAQGLLGAARRAGFPGLQLLPWPRPGLPMRRNPHRAHIIGAWVHFLHPESRMNCQHHRRRPDAASTPSFLLQVKY